jgi:hypothetical protein
MDTYAPAAAHVSSEGVSERSAVRVASGVVAALSLVLPLLMRVPERLPSTAMGSALLLYLERILAVFAILLFLLVFLYRSLVHGELPRAVSGEENSVPQDQDARPDKPTRSENLRRAREALDRQLEHRKEFFEALERLEKLGRR